LKVKKHIQAVAAPPSSAGFDAARAGWLWRSIIVLMLFGDMEVSALLPSVALADDSLSQIKPKLVFNIPAQPLVTARPLGRWSVAVPCAKSCVIRS
jgi:hypothetical protein